MKGMTKIGILAVLLAVAVSLFQFVQYSSSDPANIIDGQRVYIDDANAFIQVSPHTITGSGYIYVNLTSKVYSGNIDMLAMVNTESIVFKNIELYNPHDVIETKSYVCNGDYFNFTLAPKYAWCWDNRTDNIGTNATPIWSEVPETLLFGHDFTSGNTADKTIFWTETTREYWSAFPSAITTQTFSWNGLNKAYTARNLPITAGVNYQVRIWADAKINTGGKYWFAFHPSGETLGQAIPNGHLYALDPWWNTSYAYTQTFQVNQTIAIQGWNSTHNYPRATYMINVSGAAYNVTANTKYGFDTASLIAAGKLDANCGGLRVVNQTNSTVLNYEVESCNSANTIIHVSPDYPTTNTNGTTQQFRVFYGDTDNSTGEVFGSVWESSGVKKTLAVYTFGKNGTGVVNDSTIFRRNATLGSNTGNGVAKVNSSGLFGNALFLSGADDNSNMTMPVEIWDDIQNNLTASVWFKEDGPTVGTHAALFFKGKTGEAGDFQVLVTGVQTSCGIFTSSYIEPAIAMRPAFNYWHYYVCTYDGANIKEYIDGKLVATGAQTGNVRKSSNMAFSFGTNEYGGNRDFRGLVDDIRILNYSLSAEEINATYISTISYLVGAEEGQGAGAAVQPWWYSKNVTFPAYYSPSTNTRFNITAISASKLNLTFNKTGAMVNYTATLNSKNGWYQEILNTGIYNYSFILDDGSGNFNRTDWATFTINPVTYANISALNKGNGTVITQFSVQATNGTFAYFNLTMSDNLISFLDLPLNAANFTFNKTGFANHTVSVVVSNSSITQVAGRLSRFQEIYTTYANVTFSMNLTNSTYSAVYAVKSFPPDTHLNITTLDNYPLNSVTGTFIMAGYNPLTVTFPVNGSSEYNMSLTFIPVSHEFHVFDEASPTTPIYFDYSIANSSYTKSATAQLLYNNLPTSSVLGDVTITLTNTTYSQRKLYQTWTDTGTFNNSFYMLKTSVGNTINFLIRNSQDSPLPNANCMSQLSINGTWVIMEQSTTDDSGSCSLFMNPAQTYRVTANYTGYLPSTVSVTPTQSPYRIYLYLASQQNYSTVLSNMVFSFNPADGVTFNRSTGQTITCNIQDTVSLLEYVGLNITANRTISIFDNKTFTATGRSYSQTFDFSNYPENSNVTGICYFKRTGFSEFNVTKLWFIRNQTGGAYSLPSIMPNLGVNLGISNMAYGILSLFITLVSSAWIARRSAILGSVIALLVLGIFTFWANWFDWKYYTLIALALLAFFFIRREVQ